MIPFNKANGYPVPYYTVRGVVYSSNLTGQAFAPSENVNWYSMATNDNQAGYKLPGWRTLVKLGVQAGTPYSRAVSGVRMVEKPRYSISYKYVDTSVIPNRVGVRTDYYEGLAGMSVPSFHTGNATRANNQALVRFYGAIRAEREKLNSLITIGEAHKAVNQLRHPYLAVQNQIERYLDKLDHAFTRIRSSRGTKNPRKRMKRRIRQADINRQVRDVIAESWLETSFGLVPTLSDVENLAITLSALGSDADTRRSSVKGYGEEEFSDSPTITRNLSLDGYAYYDLVEKSSTKFRVTYRCGLRVAQTLGFSDFGKLRDLAGFNPQNFVPTIYELIPYSWLVDYVSTLGACLTANSTNTTDLLWAIKSTKIQSTFKRVSTTRPDKAASLLGNALLSTTGASIGQWETHLTTVSRELLNLAQLPQAEVQFKKLSEINPLQASNVLAVITVKLKKARTSLKLLRI